MSERTPTILLAIALFTVPLGLLAADDPIMGTWKLDTTRLGPDQEAIVRNHEPIPNGIKITRPLVDANGKPTRGTWTLKFDGKDYPVHGDSNLDTLSMNRIDMYTMEAVAKKDGKITNRMRWEVSKDGKTLTWTANRVLPPERAGTTIRVYDKQ